MKRLVSLLSLTVLVLAAGGLASGCDATPPAATINGATISTGTLNGQLQAYESTQAGACLLTIESGGTSVQVSGEGGQGTFNTNFVDGILHQSVSNVLYQQYAATKGIHVTAADLATAQSDVDSYLSGEITTQVSEASEAGEQSYCETDEGQALTGAQVLDALPVSIRNAQIESQAVESQLLARGADLSNAAIAAYYQKNPTDFVGACVSAIESDTQADANKLLAQINAGASFASVAKASSLDQTSAAKGGALGCDYTLQSVEQQLQDSSITVGTPLAPIQESSSGAWVIFEVTSESLQSLADATPTIREDLLESSSNESRVSAEVTRYARTVPVSVDPRYGTWTVKSIVPPPSPPTEYLLSAALGTSGSGSSSSSSTSTTNPAG